MGSIGYRQKGDSGPLYNPERDYAYIAPTLMVRAIENLDPSAHSPEDKLWCEQHNISQDEIVLAAEALAAAQRDFVNAADPVHSFEQALNRRNFFNLRYPVRQRLFASIGEVFCAAWFKGVREVSTVGEESPSANSMARFASAVVEFAKRNGAPTYDANFAAEHLQFRNDVLQTRLNLVYKELQAAQAERDAFVSREATATKTLDALHKTWWWRWFFKPTDYVGPK